MPSWPIEMPSETEIVPNSIGNASAPRTPSLARLANRSSDRLQGVISFHDEAMATCGLRQSSSPIPTARNMPREAARSMPSVTVPLCGLRCGRGATAVSLSGSAADGFSDSTSAGVLVTTVERTAYGFDV